MWQLIQEVWRPALEIFILAVAIYLATRFVRGTRGWPVVIGFTVLLLATTLMAALLVHDLAAGPGATTARRHPWQDEAYAAVHGGIWRAAYAPRSALGLAAVLGYAGARG